MAAVLSELLPETSGAGFQIRQGSAFYSQTAGKNLLQANYDTRTIQTLLGHSDVRTTMIYTHCRPSKTIKESKSPLDF
jgi:integrase